MPSWVSGGQDSRLRVFSPGVQPGSRRCCWRLHLPPGPPPRCQAAQLPQTAPDGTWALHASGLSELWTLPFCPAEPRLAPPQAQLVLCCPIVCRFLSPEGPAQTPPCPGACSEVPSPCGPLEWEAPRPQVSHPLVSRAWSPRVGFYCPLVAESGWPSQGGRLQEVAERV